MIKPCEMRIYGTSPIAIILFRARSNNAVAAIYPAYSSDAELGKRFVDKLVRITLNNGQEDWIYIHIEVQGTPQKSLRLSKATTHLHK